MAQSLCNTWFGWFVLHARSGKPSTYDHPALRKCILEQPEMPPPAGMSTWDGGLSRGEFGRVSADVVWRILRKEGIQLQRHRSWCVSTDPEFSAKIADKLTQTIKDFTTAYNKNASPFVWRKREVKGVQLHNTITNLYN